MKIHSIYFSNICSYDKKFLLQLSKYKIDLIFKSLASLNTINKTFVSIEPHRLPKSNIERAKEQKRFIDSHEALIFETEDSLQNTYLFLNMLKVTSKGNKFTVHLTRFKDDLHSYTISKVIDFVISPIIGWIREGWQFVVQLFGKN